MAKQRRTYELETYQAAPLDRWWPVTGFQGNKSFVEGAFCYADALYGSAGSPTRRIRVVSFIIVEGGKHDDVKVEREGGGRSIKLS